MGFTDEFMDIELSSIHADAQRRASEGWRYVQILAVNKDEGVDLIYSYMLDGKLDNVVVSDVSRDAHVESISDVYFEAFVCENEIHDLFGIAIDGIAIDFLGNFYKVAEEYPMTIITPEQLAAREKAKKIAQAKAAKEAKEAKEAKAAKEGAQDSQDAADAEKPKKAAKSLEEEEAELEAKLANMDPEKAAKVRAAFEAKKKKAASVKEGE